MNPTDPFRLDDKVAIITGASKGIGAETARLFAQRGAKVVVSSRKQDAVDTVARTIVDAGGTALAVAAHTGREEDLHALVERSIDAFGGIDVLVNNAATNPVFGGLLDAGASAFDQIMNVNLKGPYLLACRAHPHLQARGGGSIINISSIGGLRPEPGLGLYSTSKAALISLTQVMAKEWGSDGIRANAICPGLVKTKFSRALWEDPHLVEQVVGHQPIARMGTCAEIAHLCLFLAAEASAYCTGAVFTADGGHTI